MLPKQAAEFHQKTAQLLFLCCCACRDLKPAIRFLSTQVVAPDKDDWNKLIRVMRYLKRNPGLPLAFEADGHAMVD